MGVSHPGVASATANAAGTAQLLISHDKVGIVWRIYQCAILTSPEGALHVQTVMGAFPAMTPTAMVSGSAASGDPPIDLGDHDVLYFNVTNALPGCSITLSYFYEELNASSV